MRTWILLGLLTVAGTWALTQETAPKPVPAFKLRDLDGKETTLADFKGRALVIVFLTTWAEPCVEYFPTLVEVQKSYGGATFTVLGLALDEQGAKHVKQVAAEKGLNFPILMADYATVKAFGGVTGLPTTFVAEPKHYILQRYEGTVEKKTLVADIEGILKK